MMLKKYAFTLINLLAIGLFFFGCAHPQTTKNLQIGMTKAEVLELAGNPNHTSRKLNSDVWLYTDTTRENVAPTEIFFQDGKVTYIGEEKSGKSPETKSGKEFRPIGEDK